MLAELLADTGEPEQCLAVLAGHLRADTQARFLQARCMTEVGNFSKKLRRILVQGVQAAADTSMALQQVAQLVARQGDVGAATAHFDLICAALGDLPETQHHNVTG